MYIQSCNQAAEPAMGQPLPAVGKSAWQWYPEHHPWLQPEHTTVLHSCTLMGLKLAPPRTPCHMERATLPTPGGESLTLYCATQRKHACWLQIHARDKPGYKKSSFFCPSHQHSLAWTDHLLSDERKKPGDLLHRWQEGKKPTLWGSRQESCPNNALRAVSKGETLSSVQYICPDMFKIHASATEPNTQCCKLSLGRPNQPI